MKNKLLQNISAGLLVIGSVGSAVASIPTTQLTSNISMDNGYEIYLATNDADQGDLFGSGNNWGSTFQNITSLATGVDYFLHVRGYDQGGIAGFLGQFSLSGIDHVFSNNSTSLTTNTTDWKGNNTGWGQNYVASLTSLGLNGASPWGTRPNISSAATWIWSGDAYGQDIAYFSTKISSLSAVPVPAAVWLFASGLGFISFKARRKGLSS